MNDVNVKSSRELMRELKTLQWQNHALRYIFEDDSVCIVIVDEQGIVRMMNKAYADFLNITIEDAVGRHVTEIIDNTRLHIVLQTGIKEVDQIQRVRGHDAVTIRTPIVEKGKVTGAIGKVLYRDLHEVKALYQKLELLEKELKGQLIGPEGKHFVLNSIVGSSDKITELKEEMIRVALFDSTVLITGDSGTGKEVFANAIHELSGRRNSNFVKINCAAIPENILEAELFGFEDGSFTGAKKGGKVGKFEIADGGTIFLDEIGDMSLSMQVKILRVLQEKEIERIGGNERKAVDVRIIAATNQDLKEKIKQGLFREDLFYRLNVVSFEIPPLRERREDIGPLAYYFVKKYNKKFGVYIEKIDQDAMSCLERYNWPGNVRELKNTIERAYNYVGGNVIEKGHLPQYIMNADSSVPSGRLNTNLGEYEKKAIAETLESCGWNKSHAAKSLGISRANLYKKMKKYDMY